MNRRQYEPEILRLSESEDRKRYKELIGRHDVIISDTIDEQLMDLLKCRYVKDKFNIEALRKGAYREMLNINWDALESYGLWVYYPWSHRLVHLLPEEEFVEIRTNRNRYKLTLEEQQLLAGKTVGVVGLSVGQTVSVALAMERGCGWLKLADMDELELSNLNRIRTGVHNLGLPKVVAVAREIKEIDPFFKLQLYPEGLTDDNMDEFFRSDPPLDLIIDECDSIDIKILLRLKAKELNVPVLMEASDRGMIDVERFDLEPDRPILHGMVEHLDVNIVRNLETYEEKMPYMLPIVGIETLSTRMQASMLELQQSIRSWPQLASAVTYGGGMVADIARRQFLGELQLSGRFYVDIEELIGGHTPLNDPKISEGKGFPGKSKEEIIALMNQQASDLPSEAVALSHDEKEQIVRAGNHAPSLSNSQPWFIYFKENCLFLYHDTLRSKTFWDSTTDASLLSFGMMLENIEITARSMGYEFIHNAGNYQSDQHLVSGHFIKAQKQAAKTELSLAQWLYKRETSRVSSLTSPVPAHHEHLPDYLDHNAFKMKFVSDKTKIKALAEILAEYEKFRLLNPMGHEDFIKEVRWSDEDARNSGDGVDMETLYLSEAEKAGIGFLKNKSVHDYLNLWKKGNGLADIMRKIVASAPMIALIYADVSEMEVNERFRLHAGAQLERVWIAVNGLGMSFHPISSSLILNNMLHHPQKEKLLKADELLFLKDHQQRLRDFFGMEQHEALVFMFKLFETDESPKRSYRRKLNEMSHIA